MKMNQVAESTSWLGDAGTPVSIEVATLSDRFASNHDEGLLTAICGYAAPHINANRCTSAAIETVVLHLTGTQEFSGASLKQLEDLAGFLVKYASGYGRWVNRTPELIVKTIFDRLKDTDEVPIEDSIDAAILRAYPWFHCKDVPHEVKLICQSCKISAMRQYVVVCVIWALHQLDQIHGKGWYLSSKQFAHELSRHGISNGVRGRMVREILQKMRDLGFIEKIAEPVFAKKCTMYRVVDSDLNNPSQSDVQLRGEIASCSVCVALKPFYDGDLRFPDGGPLASLVLRQVAVDPLSLNGFNIVAPNPDSNIVALGYRRADAKEVKRVAEGKWEELYRVENVVTLKRKGRSKYYDCPCCGKAKTAVVFESGGIHCFRCRKKNEGQKLNDGIAVIRHFLGVDFSEAIFIIARHFDVKGEVVARAKREQKRPAKSPREVIKEYAVLKSLTPAQLEHYGANEQLVTVDRYGNQIGQMPIRGFDLDVKTYIQFGVANKTLQKGMCLPDSGDAIGKGCYLPNDFRIDDGKPVVLLQGFKDCCAAWGDAVNSGIHFIGLQDGRISEGMGDALLGRLVVTVPDCDQSGRLYSKEHQRQLQRVGVRGEVVDLCPERTDSAGIRELLQTDQGRSEFAKLVRRLTRESTPKQSILIAVVASEDYFTKGF